MPSLVFRPERFREKSRQSAEASALHDIDTGLPVFRGFLERSEKTLRRYHRGGGSGLRVAHCRAITMDTLIENLYERAQASVRDAFGSPVEVAIFALGGFGRAELSPFSDVDIMFLYPNKSRSKSFAEMQRAFNDAILYTLWDIGKKVGHCTRTVKEALVEANKDVQSKNAMLEARYLCGSRQLGNSFRREYRRFLKKDNLAAYLEERLKDQRQRRARNGGSVFRQEPDIKSGVGGLRDFQNVLWMVRLKLATDDIRSQLVGELLNQDEYQEFIDSYDFLLRVRNELHLQSRRPTEILSLDRQPKVAWNLGYRQRQTFHRVEIFMRDYYRAAQIIYRISDYLEQRLFADARTRVPFAAVIESRRHQRREILDGMVIRNRALNTLSDKTFKEDPVRLVRVFRHIQRLGIRPDFELLREIRGAVNEVDPAQVRKPDASKSMRAILQSPGSVYDPLRYMNETGVLGLLIPEWEKLHCLVQHEFYHRYTADEHTLRTIHELDGIFLQREPQQTGKFLEALEQTEHPTLLYTILLLHDIGKGHGVENHATVGANVAGRILTQLAVPDDLAKKVVFLIENHLEMARIWQRLDIDDPETIQRFAKFVGDKETLHYLYVLTWCDARGTSLDLWNGFKDVQHTRLYQSTLQLLGDAMNPQQTISRHHPGDFIRRNAPELSDEEVEAHFNLMPDRYYVYQNDEDIVLHLRMVHQLLQTIAHAESLGALVPVIEWQDDLNLDLTVVHIVTWDRAGLFYKLAGAFTLAGLNIVSSKALTRADHMTIDTFYVTEANGGLVQSQKVFEVFRQQLQEALLHNKDHLPEILERAGKPSRPSYTQTDKHLPAAIPSKVDIYHDLNLSRTIIEIQCNDHLGILYRFARAIHDHGFDITFARISTERDVVADTFYIEPVQPDKSGDTSAIIELRQSLEEIIELIPSPELE